MNQMITEVCNVLGKYDIACAILSVAILNDEGKIEAHSQTIVPKPPRDHEEEILRDNICKKSTDHLADLVQIVYAGLDESLADTDEMWTCPCGYMNNGPICTKCGNSEPL